MSKTFEEFKNRTHAHFVLNRIKCCRESRKFCDVTLIAESDGKRISAHRLILSASTEYFSALFKGRLQQSKDNEVVLSDVAGNILENIVNYIYTGNLELQEETVEELLAFAYLLQLNAVLRPIGEFCIRHLKPTNCLRYSAMGQQYHLDKLQIEANVCICKCFMEVCKTQDFFKLNASQLSQLLASDNLAVSSEENVLHSLIAWKKHDPTMRDKDMSNLLSLVRLSLLTKTFITEQVVPYFDSIECQQLIDKMLNNNKTHTKSRNSGQRLLAIGSSTQNPHITMEIYCSQQNNWTHLENSLPEREDFNTVLMDDSLYIIGGTVERGISNTALRVNLNTMDWTPISAMNEGRVQPGLAVLDGYLYSIGGYADEDYDLSLSSVERWNPLTDTWEMIKDMHRRRAGAGVAVLNGLLYVIGGCCRNGYYDSVECYDPKTKSWTYKASLSENRSAFGIESVNGYLYVFGGYDGWGGQTVETVERYDPVSNTWTLMCSRDRRPEIYSCALFENRIITASGSNYRNAVIEEYELKTNEFKQLDSTSRYQPTLLTIPIMIPKEEFQLFLLDKR